MPSGSFLGPIGLKCSDHYSLSAPAPATSSVIVISHVSECPSYWGRQSHSLPVMLRHMCKNGFTGSLGQVHTSVHMQIYRSL